MTDKELLETIKYRFEWGEENLESGIYILESEEIKWLISQAEKVDQLHQENERLKKFLNWEQEEAQGLDKEVTFQLEQLKQAQTKIERYEKALEFYADEERYKEKLISEAQCDADGIWISNDVYVPPIIYFDSGEKARQALEGDDD